MTHQFRSLAGVRRLQLLPGGKAFHSARPQAFARRREQARCEERGTPVPSTLAGNRGIERRVYAVQVRTTAIITRAVRNPGQRPLPSLGIAETFVVFRRCVARCIMKL